jgi:hypothetical protein
MFLIMRKRHNSLKYKSELGRNLALARWKKDRARRDEEEDARVFAMKLARVIGEGPVEAGQYVDTLQWHGADGKICRYRIRRCVRAGQILIDGVDSPRTVTWLLDRLRRHLSSYFRTGDRG